MHQQAGFAPQQHQLLLQCKNCLEEGEREGIVQDVRTRAMAMPPAINAMQCRPPRTGWPIKNARTRLANAKGAMRNMATNNANVAYPIFMA